MTTTATAPVSVTVFEDRTFTFVLKSPPASVLLKQAAAVAKGATNAKTDRVGSVTAAAVMGGRAIELPGYVLMFAAL